MCLCDYLIDSRVQSLVRVACREGSRSGKSSGIFVEKGSLIHFGRCLKC